MMLFISPLSIDLKKGCIVKNAVADAFFRKSREREHTETSIQIHFQLYTFDISGIASVLFPSLLGCRRQTQSRSVFDFVVFSLFFSVSGKVLPISPLLSGVFVYRVFCAYFVSFEGTGVMCRFPW